MLEPLIVLTVLNCIFMFSSTVTTCALWWQHQKHRCCARAGPVKQRSATKRSTRGIFGAIRRKPPDRSKISGHMDVTCVADGTLKIRDKKSPKRSKRHLPYLSEYQRKREEKMLGEVDARKRERRARMSEGSQTNDASSTVVMEFSTVQKVVQKIVDNPDSDINPSRIAFKDVTTLQKDNQANNSATNKKDSHEHNIEQRFMGNGKNFTITSNNND